MFWNRAPKRPPSIRTELGAFLWDGAGEWACEVAAGELPSETGQLSLCISGHEFDLAAVVILQQALSSLGSLFPAALAHAAEELERFDHRPQDMLLDGICVEPDTEYEQADFVLNLAFLRWPDGMLRVGFKSGVATWHTLDD